MKQLLLTALLLVFANIGMAEELRIAAASDLNFALPEIARQFEQRTGTTVKISFGSSGNFFTQIQNGAPFDLFFSADTDFPKKLEAAGLTEPGMISRYATGRLVLWVPNASKVDLAKGLRALT